MRGYVDGTMTQYSSEKGVLYDTQSPSIAKFAKMSYLPSKFGENAKNCKRMQNSLGEFEPAMLWIGQKCRALDLCLCHLIAI